MTDSAGKTPDPSLIRPDPSLIRTVTLQRLSAQLEKMEKARHRSIPCSPESHGSEPPEKAISTGIEALDRLLPDAGFREGTLVEWLAEAGSGDQLALLAAGPALGKDRFLIVIDSEKKFYPPAAAALGIDLGRLILVRPGKFARSTKTLHPVLSPSEGSANAATAASTETPHTETLWALEQTLQSRGVAVTFCRLQRLNARVFRRLQLAAERGGGLGFLIRAPSARNEPSWSDVRLWVEPACAEFSPSGRRWRVEVLRCRRGEAGQRSILLEYDDATHTVHPASEAGGRDQGVGVSSAALPKRARRA
jgi:protein ImuA